MKKLLAIILSVICLFSCMATPASAANIGTLGELGSDFFSKLFGVEFEEDTPIVYGVTYANDTLSGVKIIYKPNATNSFENPGLYTITSDTPLSIDHEFICWEDSKGNKYYAGDKIYVDGNITLYAVWTEKTDNDVRVVRILKTTIEALRRLIGTFLGFFRYVVEFDENYVPTDPKADRLYDIKVNEAIYENGESAYESGNERILFYLDSYIYYNFDMKRIESTEGLTADIYFCTGWHEATREPLNIENFECTYKFSELQGPNNSDVLIIDTKTADSEISKIYTEKAGLENGQTYYMVVTVGDSLYSAKSPDNGKIYNEYTNPITCVFTLTANVEADN